ncbi:ArsR/SmtB family transcription factor [Pelobacter propionicus]|uniref:Transcriptional regulator, ArsR family n=1 Tax=Pelobacter propionicus (strain DSM 2379 / NBRC 103807 / OttBd1) TaxID=338966 RepID=A1AQC0_PELPD|nr:metalloregulator ArsR/SmtB family transcription factor [Pelobacter propionicus]ABK99540.1 transcriptional regulator, ArsR family [Pelobacter propionicus DSM 2379]
MEFEEVYSTDFCSRRLKAIADPTRWAVVAQLIHGPRTVGELNGVLGMESTLLSHHLKILRDEGLVECLREGKNVRYFLSADVELTPSGRGINLGCCVLQLSEPVAEK